MGTSKKSISNIRLKQTYSFSKFPKDTKCLKTFFPQKIKIKNPILNHAKILLMVLKSDVLKRPGIIKKFESDYKNLQKMEKPEKINFNFHAIQRKGSELTYADIDRIKDSFTFKLTIEPYISDASSSNFKEGDGSFCCFYPSSMTLLESFIRYNI